MSDAASEFTLVAAQWTVQEHSSAVLETFPELAPIQSPTGGRKDPSAVPAVHKEIQKTYEKEREVKQARNEHSPFVQ